MIVLNTKAGLITVRIKDRVKRRRRVYLKTDWYEKGDLI